MATYTSTQSGPFDVASTWGGAGVPGDGDTFNVSQGHIVAVTGDIRPTNGFENSNVYGKLHLQGSGCMLRMNGTLLIDSLTGAYFTEGSNSAPYFRMDPGSILELRGTNADAHRLYVRNENYIQVEILGTNPNPQTTITTDAIPSGDFTNFTFNDASDFRAGDWITVYMPERPSGLPPGFATKSWIHNRSDEGFWIHDIDNNDVYIRQFVGPEATITAAKDNKIIVDDASVFRKGYRIIFGTGSNRNHKEITDIGYGSNTLTLDSNVTGSVIGETVYESSIDKGHLSGDKVLRLAAVTTADADAGVSGITVNNTNGFSVGDMILIQSNDTNYSNTNTWDKIADYTITDINTSTNVITFTNGYTSSSQTTLHMNTKAGALVVNATRDTQIRAPEGTTYGTDQRSSVYFQGTGGYYYRRYKIKNVLINLGSHSDYNNYAIIGMRGASSYTFGSYGNYVSEFEGNVIYPVYRNSRNTGYLYEQHQLQWRNNISYNAGGDGWLWYGSAMGMYNNISMRCGGWFNCGNDYYHYNAAAYNYIASCGYGMAASQCATHSEKNYHHNIMKIIHNYAVSTAYNYGTLYFYRNYYDAFTYFSSASRTGRVILLDCYTGNTWDATNPNGAGIRIDGVYHANDGYQEWSTQAGVDASLYSSICDNFKYNGFKQMYRASCTRIWDHDEKAWLVFPDYDYNNSTYMTGFPNTVFLPAGATARISGTVKMRNASATNYPYIISRKVGSSYTNGQYYTAQDNGFLAKDDPKIGRVIGFNDQVRFTSASQTDYETKTATVGPFKVDIMLKTGIAMYNNSTGYGNRGWYEKDLKIVIDKPQNMPLNYDTVNQLTTSIPVRYGLTADEQRTIWGG